MGERPCLGEERREEILPVRVFLLDEVDLPLAPVLLQRLFPLNGEDESWSGASPGLP
jgi:hypothetical protein